MTVFVGVIEKDGVKDDSGEGERVPEPVGVGVKVPEPDGVAGSVSVELDKSVAVPVDDSVALLECSDVVEWVGDCGSVLDTDDAGVPEIVPLSSTVEEFKGTLSVTLGERDSVPLEDTANVTELLGVEDPLNVVVRLCRDNELEEEGDTVFEGQLCVRDLVVAAVSVDDMLKEVCSDGVEDSVS